MCKGQLGAREEGTQSTGKGSGKEEHPCTVPVRKGWMGWDRHMCRGGTEPQQGMQRLPHMSVSIFVVLFQSLCSANVSETPVTQGSVFGDLRECKLAVPKGHVTQGSALALPHS